MVFYRHFQDISEVIAIHVENQFVHFSEELSTINLTSSYDSSIVLFNHIKEEKDFYGTLIIANHTSLLHKYFESFMKYLFKRINYGYKLDDDDLSCYESYRVGGIVQLIVT